MELKKCTECYKEKPYSEFYKNATTKDKKQKWCKTCIDNRIRELRKQKSQSVDDVAKERNGRFRSLPPIDADCYHGDHTKTKMYQNRHFTSGDGGYQDYINEINIARG